MTRDALERSPRLSMNTPHALKLGLFGANCSSSRTATRVPERWSGSFADCLTLARMADAAGIDFMLPIGRWKGYGGETDFHGTTLETITWASGLLAATERITVFGTVHAPLFHPLVAAKQMVTADEIGRGRFGLNIVAGWNEGEFEMFGLPQKEHDQRYAFAEEWLDVIRLAWEVDNDDADFKGRWFDLQKIRAKPKPFGGSRPMIMNAGSSGAGQKFALRNCDAFFTATAATRTNLDGAARRVAEIKAEAASYGRDVEVFTVGQVICRPTEREAIDYHRHANIEMADWDAVERMMALRNITRTNTPSDEFDQKRRYFAGNAIGGYPFVGTPDKVAEDLAAISRAGVRGVAVSFVNYIDELPYFRDEVLPRLVHLGVRRG